MIHKYFIVAWLLFFTALTAKNTNTTNKTGVDIKKISNSENGNIDVMLEIIRRIGAQIKLIKSANFSNTAQKK